MPLDSHSFLMSQGWEGKGAGLRQGAISKPIVVKQKKSLAGVGKDRDEAFPFWDHLFSAAANAIKLKCFSDDEDENDNEDGGSSSESENTPSSSQPVLKRTTTGILSNRRPTHGTSVPLSGTDSSGQTTPSSDSTPSSSLSLMTQAKREAAKRGLYSRFFKGPLLDPKMVAEEEKRLVKLVSEAFSAQEEARRNMHGGEKDDEDVSISIKEHITVTRPDGSAVRVDVEVKESKTKKRRRKEVLDEGEEARKELKRRRKEEKREKEQNSGENLVQEEAVVSNVDEDKEARNERKRRRKEKEEKKKKSKGASVKEEDVESKGKAKNESMFPSVKGKHHKKNKHRSDELAMTEADEDAIAGTNGAEKTEHRRRKEAKKRLQALQAESTSSPEDKSPSLVPSTALSDRNAKALKAEKKKKRREERVSAS